MQAWQPKDHEERSVPLPKQAVSLLAAWQSIAPEGCPYVFMVPERRAFYRERIEQGTWRAGQDLVNNLLRRFKTICRKAGVGPYTFHDLRRSCITNWAQRLPTHVVQRLAGHSDITTTQRYYLRVRDVDIDRAQQIQSELLGDVPAADVTDPLLTHSAPIRGFPGGRGQVSEL